MSEKIREVPQLAEATCAYTLVMKNTHMAHGPCIHEYFG